jgi:hypothetical protein
MKGEKKGGRQGREGGDNCCSLKTWMTVSSLLWFAFAPKFECWKFDPQCRRVGRWGHGPHELVVIRSGFLPEGQALSPLG